MLQQKGVIITKMDSAHIILKMIGFSNGNLHDINHFLKVYAYAKTIADCEKLSDKERQIIEIAAVIHDIACPLCREKYGNTDGKNQEAEGAVLAREFLKDAGLTEDMEERIVFLVGHHHTLQNIDGMDYQILIEADYLVNADEAGYSEANIQNMMDTVFRTETGKMLLKSVYLPRKLE